MNTLDMAPTIPRGMSVSLQTESTVHRGDIVAITVPTVLKLHGVNYLLRRVVGLPGETISARDGHIAINARTLVEPYLRHGTNTPDFRALHIPVRHYFVLGDNRDTALDSRRFGTVTRTDIVGRVTL
jgi:signal peptidase I